MKKYSLLFACLIALLSVQPASAHPADMYYQAIAAHLSPTGIRIDWEILPGPILTQVMWFQTDRDQDQLISDAEAGQWAEPVVAQFHLEMDSIPLEVRLESVKWPSTLSGFQSGNEPIRIQLSADWPDDSAGEHDLVLRDGFNSQISITWFHIFGEDGITFHLPEQSGGRLDIQFVSVNADSRGSAAEFATWESGRPSIPGIMQTLGLGEVAEKAANEAPQKQGMSAILEGLLRSRESSPWFIFPALAIAAIVGALHALTPGHGKTIVAAYLIGSRGTVMHAAFLGGIVTLTHTGSVFLLGLVTLAASQYILPTSLFPILEILSGILIIGLGASLLYQRVRAWMENRAQVHVHDHDLLNTKGTKGHKGNGSLSGKVHDHDHSHVHDGHAHHHHEGAHHDHDHHIPDPSEINWRTLLALGISGGLVPCPEAIAILLLAISLSRILLGLSLILAFSLGLAFILIAIGVTMVQSKRLFSRLGFLDRWAYTIPIISASVVLLLGLGLTFGAVKNAQALVTGAQTSTQSTEAKFDLAQARVIFMALDENKHNQLYVVPATGGGINQVTLESQGVRDYSVSPDGSLLAYGASDETGGTIIWKLDAGTLTKTRLLACPSAICGKMIWPRTGSRALYSRLEMTSGQSILGVPSIWWLDMASGDTGPVFQDSQIPVVNFDWSMHGTWLSYTSAVTPEIKINNLGTGESYSIPTRTGGHLLWSPVEDAFLLVDIWEAGDNTLQKVYRYEAGSEEGMLLDDDRDFDESDPAWSSDAQWIALVRYANIPDAPSAGDQIWLVKADGSQLHPLTNDADTLHVKPVWSPDGNYLLFTYSRIGDPLPRIRILEVETGRTWDLSPNGNHPLWLP